MVILCPGCVAPSVHHNFLPRWLLLNNSWRMYCRVFSDRMKPKRQNRHQRMACFSNGSSFQGAVALKYGARGDSFELTPTELFVGTAGFLANKVAVLLAAFMPMLSDSKSEDGSGDIN